MNLTFNSFKTLAQNTSLPDHERIGFPAIYRAGYEDIILEDIETKVPALGMRDKTIVDIGCGCGLLTQKMLSLCHDRNHTVVLIDSEEVLSALPDGSNIKKVPGRFPKNSSMLQDYIGIADGVIIYSVLQHVILEDSVFSFIDHACQFLVTGGCLLLGDIPNITKARRYFTTEEGIAKHRENHNDHTSLPFISAHGTLETGKFDDSIILGILGRYRAAGYESHLLPQPSSLPLSNRREDITIVKR